MTTTRRSRRHIGSTTFSRRYHTTPTYTGESRGHTCRSYRATADRSRTCSRSRSRGVSFFVAGLAALVLSLPDPTVSYYSRFSTVSFSSYASCSSRRAKSRGRTVSTGFSTSRRYSFSSYGRRTTRSRKWRFSCFSSVGGGAGTSYSTAGAHSSTTRYSFFVSGRTSTVTSGLSTSFVSDTETGGAAFRGVAASALGPDVGSGSFSASAGRRPLGTGASSSSSYVSTGLSSGTRYRGGSDGATSSTSYGGFSTTGTSAFEGVADSRAGRGTTNGS